MANNCYICSRKLKSTYTQFGELRECLMCGIGYDVDTLKWYSLGDGEYLPGQEHIPNPN